MISTELRKFVAPEYIYGNGARYLTGKYAQNLGAKKVLLVTDKVVQKEQWVLDVIESLKQENLKFEIFNNISPNPRDYEVMEGAESYKSKNCDVIIAIGGGSVLDAAKGIGIVATNNKAIHYFEGIDKIQVPMPPLVCIPTTGGTSADVSQFAIINNISDKYKMAIISKAVVPDLALIDPETLNSMSGYLTACTGIDALAHAFESFVSNANSPFTDLYAIESVKLITRNLPLALKNQADSESRNKLMLGSLYAGLAFSNASLGCVHSLAHSLGGYFDLPHGECNAILLPHVVDYNYDSASERYSELGKHLGLDVRSSSTNNKKELVEYLLKFKQDCGISNTLNNHQITSDILPDLARRAINDPCNATNPKAPSKKDLELIYSEAI